MSAAVYHTAPARYDFLDGLRGFAAILVALFHCALPSQLGLLNLSGYCVDLFFVLSGFVIAANYQLRIQAGMKTGEFLAYRLARLYPMYLIGLAIGVIGLIWQTQLYQTSYTWQELAFALTYNLFYLPYLNINVITLQSKVVVGEIFPFNWPAWSLFFEMAVNLLFIINLRYFRLTARSMAALAFVPFAIIILLNHGDAGWGSKNWFLAVPRVIFGFYAGVVIWEWSRTPRYRALAARLNPQRLTWMLAILLMVALVSSTSNPAYYRYAFFVGIVLLPFAVAMATALTTPAAIRPAFAFLGFLSYPLYCLHGAVIHVLEAANASLQLGLKDWSYAATAFAASLVLAVLLATAVDEPLRRLLRNKLKLWFAGASRKTPAVAGKGLPQHLAN